MHSTLLRRPVLLPLLLVLVALSLLLLSVTAQPETPATSANNDEEPTIYDRYFAKNPSRYPVVCKRIFEKFSGDEDSIPVAKLEQRFQHYANKSAVFNDLKTKWSTLDTNGECGWDPSH